jgi:HSP20 family protein
MPHYRFDPMKEFENLSQRMRKFADEFPETFSLEFGKGFEPKVDVYHDDASITVIAELPGMAKNEISVSLADGVLTLKGEKKLPVSTEGITVLRSERSFGEFRRLIELPGEVDANSISAQMDAGVLSIVIRKKARSQDKEITIEIG